MTLDALCHLSTPSTSFEVIVTDDGAVPPLEDRLRPYRSKIALRVLRLERQGPGAARNAAARLATAPLLVFLDDDCVPDPDWLQAYLNATFKAPDCILAGPILNGLPDDLCSEACHRIFGYLYSRHLIEPGSHAPFVISANFAVPARAFRATGGFDEAFRTAAEDRMFSEEWSRSGRSFHAVPAATVRHHRPLTLASFLSQQFRYGRGGMIFRRAVQRRGWTLKPVESSSFYSGLLGSAFRDTNPAQGLLLFVLLVLSQLAITAGYVAEHRSATQ